MPPKVDSGFVKADSGNLPKISMFMVLESLFYSVNLNRRNKLLIEDNKKSLMYKFMYLVHS